MPYNEGSLSGSSGEPKCLENLGCIRRISGTNLERFSCSCPKLHTNAAWLVLSQAVQLSW